MNLLEHPDLADRLAAAYGLGTLRGGARRRFEAQARRSPALRAAALAWQERFAAITELQAGEQPSANVWRRIEIGLAQERNAQAAATQREIREERRGLRWWRGAAFAGGMAAVAALGVTAYLAGEVGRQPAIQYVAVLDDQQFAPAILVTFDPKHSTLTLKRIGAFQEGPDKSLQLWALPPSGSPRSLGILGTEPVVKLTAAESQVGRVPALAVSLEPKGGVPGERGPTGPVLFKGALLQTP